MKALVTGGTGFIGSALVDALLAEGFRVRCLVRPHSNLRWLQELPVEVLRGDFSHRDTLARAVAGMDYVFHVAGVTRAHRRAGYFQGNYQVTLNLLQACEEFGSPHQKFILVSSLAAAGPSGPGEVLTEEAEPRPVSAYGESKLQAEQAVLAFSRRRPAIIIRPPVVYGPRDEATHLIFKSIQGGLHLIPGRGAQQVSLVHVHDLVAGMLLAARSPRAPGRVYYISDDAPYDWQTIGELLAQVLGRQPVTLQVPHWVMHAASVCCAGASQFMRHPLHLSPDKMREIRQAGWLCSNRRAREELGFQPAIQLREGLAATAAWYKRHGWL